MKSFLLTLFPNLTAKAAITAVACVTAGAAATAAVTTVVYQQKSAEYQKTINELQSANQDAAALADAAAGDFDAKDTNIRVLDGMVQVWDGEQWVDYGTVDEVASGDPFYENAAQKEQTEKAVVEKQLAKQGLTVDEDGKIVKISVGEVEQEEKKLLVGSASVENGTQNKAGAKAGVQAGAQAGAVLPGTPVIMGIPQTTDPNAATTVTTWTSGGSDGGSSGGGSDDSADSAPASSGGGSSGGGGNSGGGSSGGGNESETVTEEAQPVEGNNNTGEGDGFDEDWSSEEL